MTALAVPPLRVGLIGLGVIARYYLAALDRNPDVRLAAVCDLDARRLSPFHGRVDVHIGHRALIAAGGLDAVIVTTPNDSHAPIARDALDAGLAVCVEKPLAVRLAEAEDLYRRAQAANRTLFTAFHRRYNSAIQQLLAGLPGGPAVTGITVRYLERIEEHVGDDAWYLDPDRCGGGCVADNGPNAFDLVRLCADEGEVRLARADIRRDASGCDRYAVVTLLTETASGRVVPARVELDWAYPGECKDVVLDLADGGRRTADLLAGYDGFKASLWHEYTGIVADFAARVRRPPVPDEGGRAALRLVAQCYRAESALVEVR